MPGANFEASGDKRAVTTAEGTGGAEVDDAGGGAEAIGGADAGALAIGGAPFIGGALIIGGALAMPEPCGGGVGAGFGLPPQANGASETAASAAIMLLPTERLFMRRRLLRTAAKAKVSAKSAPSCEADECLTFAARTSSCSGSQLGSPTLRPRSLDAGPIKRRHQARAPTAGARRTPQRTVQR